MATDGMAGADSLARLARAVARASEHREKSSEHVATVLRVDSDGVTWVAIDGGADETPVNGMAYADASPGDVVRVAISGGRCSLLGNATSPAVGQTVLRDAVGDAVSPVEKAMSDASDEISQVAYEALESVAGALSVATQAHAAATGALEAANSAMAWVGVLRREIGSDDWLADNGTFALTQDVSPDPAKVYFELVGGSYVAVESPDESDMGGYYELDAVTSVYEAAEEIADILTDLTDRVEALEGGGGGGEPVAALTETQIGNAVSAAFE